MLVYELLNCYHGVIHERTAPVCLRNEDDLRRHQLMDVIEPESLAAFGATYWWQRWGGILQSARIALNQPVVFSDYRIIQRGVGACESLPYYLVR